MSKTVESLVSDTKLVGRFFKSAVWHPANYGHLICKLDWSDLATYGVYQACDLASKEEFIFHEVYKDRLNGIIKTPYA